jgi:hypothetical protein
MTRPGRAIGEYRLRRQAGGRGYFAQVRVEAEESGDRGPAQVLWSVDPADQTSAQSESDPQEAEAAVDGATDVLAALPAVGVDTHGWTVHIRHLGLNLVDNDVSAVRAAAGAATAAAFDAADRFDVVFDDGWHCRARTT